MESFLRREKEGGPKDIVIGAVERLETEREVVSARLDEFAEGLEARSDGVAFPAGDLGAVAADAFAEFGLGAAGSQADVADDVRGELSSPPCARDIM